MITELLKKIVNAILDRVVGPLPVTKEPPRPPKPIRVPIQEVADDLREFATMLHQQADKLNPMVWPNSIPNLPYPNWNHILDASGEKGIIKRKDLTKKSSEEPILKTLKELEEQDLLDPVDPLFPLTCCSKNRCGKNCNECCGPKFSCQTNEWLDEEFTHDKEMINVFKKAFRKALEKKCCHSCCEEKELDQATMPNCCGGGDCGKECRCTKTNESKDLEAGAKFAQEIADVLSKRWGLG